jgi:hypothetical protein
MWWIIGAAAVGALFTSRQGPNAVGGTATLGGLVGIGLLIFWPGTTWWWIARSAAVGALIGLAFELLPRLVGRQ